MNLTAPICSTIRLRVSPLWLVCRIFAGKAPQTPTKLFIYGIKEGAEGSIHTQTREAKREREREREKGEKNETYYKQSVGKY